jgi:hypothetical protein
MAQYKQRGRTTTSDERTNERTKRKQETYAGVSKPTLSGSTKSSTPGAQAHIGVAPVGMVSHLKKPSDGSAESAA